MGRSPSSAAPPSAGRAAAAPPPSTLQPPPPAGMAGRGRGGGFGFRALGEVLVDFQVSAVESFARLREGAGD